MRSTRSFTLLLIALACSLSLVSAIKFSYDLPVKKIVCFGDSLGEQITVQIDLYSPNTNYQFRVYDPQGKQAFNATHDLVINQKLTFVTHSEGNYQFCFSNMDPAPIKVQFSYKTGFEANDYASLTSKSDFEPIQLQVQQMEDMLSSIGKERRMITRKSRYITKDTDQVSFKVLAFSVITLVLMALLTAFQVIYLKNFFKTKKLI